ncbi:MAG: antibiotic biosynthesis monooxygenase [Actinobacteria bacterium]|nr:antibiotic biosynthesis monooxygenase [Actinomycetota bacterium]
MLRANAGLLLVGEWTTASGNDQRPAADAALDAWRDSTWPPGLLAHHCLLGEDGRTLLHYQQWTSSDACRAFVATGRPLWLESVDAAVPGIQHRQATTYRLYRSTPKLDDAPSAGCLATVTVDFDGADPQRQEDWVNSVFAAADTDQASLEAGLIAAHFHISVDGTRVLNLAEWTTARAHRQATAEPATRLRTTTQQFPGVTGIAVHRFSPYRGITLPAR